MRVFGNDKDSYSNGIYDAVQRNVLLFCGP